MKGKQAEHMREQPKNNLCVAPKYIVLALFSIMLFISLSASSLATLNVLLSDQGTGVKDKLTQQTVTLGNLTVDVYDALTGGNLIYTQTFSNVIKNGSWNVMLGETTPLPLEFGKAYYRDYKINGEDASFTNGTGQTVGRQVFYSSLGDINGSKLITGTVTRNKIESCANGQIIKMSEGTWACADEAAFTDTNCSIDGSCPNIIYDSEEAALNVNSTTWWAQLTGWVAGWFYRSGNSLAFNETKLNATIDARTSWLGDNASWNEGYADTQYLHITDQRYNDTAAIGSLNTSKAATGTCAAGYAIQNATSGGVQCTALPSLSETDPRFTSENASIWSGINSKLTASDQRYNDTAAINAVDNAKLDKTDQRYNDTTAINAVDNAKLDKTDQRYNDTPAINAVDNTKLDKTDQRYNDTAAISSVSTNTNARIDSINSTKAAAANCAAGYVVQNTTTSGVQCLQIPSLSETDPVFTSENASIWSGINSKLTATDQRYNDTAAISSMGNWTADKQSYTATAGLVAILGNWSADKANYVTSTLFSSIGNWSLDKSGYTLTNELVGILGNWSLDKPSYITSAQVDTGYYNKTASDGRYATSAALSSVGNWTLDKSGYYNRTQTDSLITQNITNHQNTFKHGNTTQEIFTAVDNQTFLRITDQRYNDTSAITAVDNAKLDKTDQRYNDTAAINAVDNAKLDKTDQRYNDTARIDAVNTTSNIQSLGFVAGQHRKGDGVYLYNDTDTIYLNETKLNLTIDSRDSDTTYNFQCPAGQFVKNLTSTGGYVCEAASGSGDITSVQADNRYVYNGSDTGDVSLAFNESMLNATIDSRAAAFGDNASWNEGYANTKYLQLEDQRYNDSAAINSIGNWTLDKPGYTATSGLVTILGNWSLDKPNYITATTFNTIGNWTLDKPSYTATSGLVAILGNWSLDKPGYTLTSGLVGILGNWSADKANYVTSTLFSSIGNWSLDKSGYTLTNELVGILGNWSLDKPSYITSAQVDTGYYNKTLSDAKYAVGTAYESVNYTTIDITSSATTYNETVFLRLTLQPSRTYAVECEIINDAAAATTGVQLMINTTGSPTRVTTVYQSLGSATAMETYSGTNTASNAFADLGSSTATYGIGTIRSRIVTGASTSVWSIQMRSEIAASQARVRAGSYCKSLRLA